MCPRIPQGGDQGDRAGTRSDVPDLMTGSDPQPIPTQASRRRSDGQRTPGFVKEIPTQIGRRDRRPRGIVGRNSGGLTLILSNRVRHQPHPRRTGTKGRRGYSADSNRPGSEQLHKRAPSARSRTSNVRPNRERFKQRPRSRGNRSGAGIYSPPSPQASARNGCIFRTVPPLRTSSSSHRRVLDRPCHSRRPPGNPRRRRSRSARKR